jgi:hypothetical protein
MAAPREAPTPRSVAHVRSVLVPRPWWHARKSLRSPWHRRCIRSRAEGHNDRTLFLEYKVGARPIVTPDSRRIVGVVGYIDILRAVQDMLEEG